MEIISLLLKVVMVPFYMIVLDGLILYLLVRLLYSVSHGMKLNYLVLNLLLGTILILKNLEGHL
ncbi:hypothetical protein C1646_695958 [Rhizophagus diaphanus]|nr:hypothetical protein C1646_695958 [Rhizophagus diaphanus] [Rhizophagus sp. MUCL 43196]